MQQYDTHRQTLIYPESDGTPVGETDNHRDLLFELVFVLKNILAQQVAYVAGNNFIYYEDGNPTAVVSPDVYVVFGIPQAQRRTFKTWEHEGKTPDLVIELTSAETRYEDLGRKRVLYAELGVQEYYLFDPLSEYLKPQLRGYELVDGELLPLSEPRLFSRLLNAELRAEGWRLRLYDLATGARYMNAEEAFEARQQAEAEIERLRAEIARLRGS